MRHADTCVHRPGVRELVAQLLERPDAPGDALSSREYAAAAIAHNARAGYGLRAPSQRALDEQLGGWRAVCEWAGLRYTRKPPEGGEQREAAIMAEVQREQEEAWAVLEAERERSYGLPVCRVRTLANGAVAYMLK